MEKSVKFPKNFKWGIGTATVQVDGAAFEDGKGISNWDVYPTIDGLCYQNQNAFVGCDHYHRYKEDFALLTDLGVQTYRFSFSWVRIIPHGVGDINEKGLAWYDKLFKELKDRNLEICATIFHWDYPNELIEKGGWLNPESPKWFFEYAKVVIDRYKDVIKYWVPINEPPNVIEVGGVEYKKLYTVKEKLQMAHNILLAHGLVAKYLKDNNCIVGTAFCSSLYAPASNSKEDIEAARKAMFAHQRENFWNASFWSDPVVLGKYPDEYYEIYSEEERPNITKEDMKLISTPLDFYGHNIYTGSPVKADKNEKCGYKILNHPVGNPKTGMDWEVFPEIMYWAPKFLYERYKLPFFIMENGCVVTDIVTIDKKVHDGPRIEYLKQYLYYFGKAIEDGVDARGYFMWALMDNYEWFNGFSKRFGITYIDYQTKERIKKDSFDFYKDIIKNNKVTL